VSLAALTIALLVAAPVVYASYDGDSGVKTCPEGKSIGLKVRGKGNPIYVRAIRRDGTIVIYADWHTGSEPRTKRFYPGAIPAKRYIDWYVAVRPSDPGAYISRQGTYGFCYG
jgi:hypothetical protein